MPSTPTTKSQVQAYQFVLRRMQSALVRKDAVMLHDPMRTHSRATIVGVVLSMLGLLGFVIWGFIKPAPTPPKAGIVIGEQSGEVYVKTENPSYLIPTFNLASARLLLMAQQEQQQQQGQGGQQAGSAPPAQAAQTEVKPATVVPDDQLKDIPRKRMQGIVDAPQLLPTKEQRIADHWAVCDNIISDANLPTEERRRQARRETAVLAGVDSLGTQGMGRELQPNEAVLVRGDNQEIYLIYRLIGNVNQPNASAVKAKIDGRNGIVQSTLGLGDEYRQASMGLLNAIPEVDPLRPIEIPNAGNPSQFNIDGLPIGSVFKTQSSSGQLQFWAILQDGVQEISELTGDLIRNGNQVPGRETVTTVSPDRLNNVQRILPGMPQYLKVDEFPKTKPTILDSFSSDTPVTCLGWQVRGEGANRDGHTAIFVSNEIPFPKDKQGNRYQPVDIGQANPDATTRVDKFYMPYGRAAFIRAAQSKESFDTGQMSIVSDRGMRYGVPDMRIAQGLGLEAPTPAPELIIGLLPTGSSLNTRDVLRTYDSVQIDPNSGSFPTSSAAPAPPG
ncbi:type VII secretion protein EccB [Amycolatopsis suaedae]|uniref:Type VII secretion protein EccB n=1 Tax=Amycolatopsis suaedae TaxID=2510978 RepID=A0A4Q7JCP0_9PSEU|nr:type VII secretion protein EccB [Amycolatopsis suaedae]RZQ64094.1 type VII secretion protein EccB [Amycolatopsis suaedae]